MSFSPMAYAESLRIGSVDFVSPDEIKVLLDIEAPDSVALNTGTARPFPRINGYVLIPSDSGHLVAQVEWITIERSQYPKRRGMQDFGLVDLPYPLRKMSLNPLGCLRAESDDRYIFQRGVGAYPTVGDPVFLPTQTQLRAIVESGDARHVTIGTSPLAANATVSIDPDRLFGRHLAVLGNTGSGKSCSVAGLIRWSLQAARKEADGKDPNARFIVLDPNGEYGATFGDLGCVRNFAVEPTTNISPLKLPLWFWNSGEWSAFSRASERAQRPLLRRALREIRNGANTAVDPNLILRRKVSSIFVSLRSLVRSGENYEGWRFGPKLSAFIEDMTAYARNFPVHQAQLESLRDDLMGLIKRPNQTYSKRDGSTGYQDFPASPVEAVIQKLEAYLGTIGGAIYESGPSEDAPLPFSGAQFADHLESLASQESNPQYFDSLIMRVRTMLGDVRINQISEGGRQLSLEEWLKRYLGDNNASNGSISVIDLSLVPVDVVHIVAAVIARMTLEALQRYRDLSSGTTLPTVLVMEEAHTFIKRYPDDADNQTSAAICCQVFEKIAREGRKFGLGLVLSSQRPSELSPIVLSQCNTFLLHRISNDRDQELVQKLVPDNLRGLLRDLPSLPSRHAILLGWASELPVLVQMNALEDAHRPCSNDPDFWKVWSRASERTVDWKVIADDWQQRSQATSVEDDVPGVDYADVEPMDYDDEADPNQWEF